MEMHTQMALEQMIEALELVTSQDDTLVELLRCVCIVLQMGNCTFELQQQEGGDADKNHECTVVANSNGSLEALARLWGIMDDDDSDSATTMLTKALTQFQTLLRFTWHSSPQMPSWRNAFHPIKAHLRHRAVAVWVQILL